MDDNHSTTFLQKSVPTWEVNYPHKFEKAEFLVIEGKTLDDYIIDNFGRFQHEYLMRKRMRDAPQRSHYHRDPLHRETPVFLFGGASDDFMNCDTFTPTPK